VYDLLSRLIQHSECFRWLLFA